jgi:hypothetical protein
MFPVLSTIYFLKRVSASSFNLSEILISIIYYLIIEKEISREEIYFFNSSDKIPLNFKRKYSTFNSTPQETSLVV